MNHLEQLSLRAKERLQFKRVPSKPNLSLWSELCSRVLPFAPCRRGGGAYPDPGDQPRTEGGHGVTVWICAREDLSVPSLTAPCPPQYVFLPHTFWRERPKRGLDRMTGLSLGCTLLGSHVHHRLAFVPLRPVHARAEDPHLQRAAWKGRREARGELGGERTHRGCHQVRAVKRHGRLICSSRLRPLEALWRQTG